MRARRVCRAQELADYLEVSISTIYRDVAHLQASGLPIDGEAGVGYILRPGFNLPSMTFTHDQIDALAIGLAFVERTGDPLLAIAAAEARAKIQAGLPQPEERKLSDSPYFSLQSRNRSASDVSSIRKAIRKRFVTQLIYTDSEGKGSRRRVHPLVVWNITDGWMFSAWCELRHDFRTFRCDRIADLTVTDEVFPDDAVKGLRAFLAREDCRSDERLK